MEGNQDNDRPTAVEEEEVANLFNVSPDIAVSLAARENKPDVLKQLIQEGKPINTKDIPGWTALHHAAFLGHTECVRILLNEETCEINYQASDGMTPLTAACANLPTSKECVKVLCEYKANPNLATNMGNGQIKKNSISIAIETKPDLEVIKWLVCGGADIEKYIPLWDDYLVESSLNPAIASANSIPWVGDLMMCLFNGEFGNGWANHPAYERDDNLSHVNNNDNHDDDDNHDEDENHVDEFAHLRPETSELAEIAMYLAKHGAVRNALAAVLISFEGGSNILTPQLLDEVVECFLENGAVLNTKVITDQYYRHIRPSVLFLFARKSIMFIEGLPTSLDFEQVTIMYPYPNTILVFSALMIMVLQGQASGIVPITAVKEIHEKLKSTIIAWQLPPNFRPIEALYVMTKNPPSLSQLARTRIRTQLAECGKFCRENLKKLPLPDILIDFVQLADLGDGSEFKKIMEAAEDWI